MESIKLENIIIYFVLVLFFVHLICDFGHCKKSKHVITYSSSVHICDNVTDDFISSMDVQPKRLNETTAVLDGYFILSRGFDSPLRLQITAFKQLAVAGTREIISEFLVPDICVHIQNRGEDPDSMNDEDSAYNKVVNVINGSDCPVSPGLYYVDKMVADKNIFPKNALMEGVYTVMLEFFSVPEDVDVPENMPDNDKLATKKEVCVMYDMTLDKIT